MPCLGEAWDPTDGLLNVLLQVTLTFIHAPVRAPLCVRVPAAPSSQARLLLESHADVDITCPMNDPAWFPSGTTSFPSPDTLISGLSLCDFQVHTASWNWF